MTFKGTDVQKNTFTVHLPQDNPAATRSMPCFGTRAGRIGRVNVKLVPILSACCLQLKKALEELGELVVEKEALGQRCQELDMQVGVHCEFSIIVYHLYRSLGASA